MKKLIYLALALCAILFIITSCAHVHNFGEWTVTKRPTCTEAGEQERVCSCGEKQTQAIPSTGHSFGEWKTIKEPTCTEPGEQERICNCGEKQTQSVPAAHKSGGWLTVTAATCASAGLKHKVCTVCGQELETEIVPVNNNHVFGKVDVVKAATCSEDGLEECTCSVCGYVKSTIVAALGHDPDGNSVCRRCGVTIIQTTAKERLNIAKVAKVKSKVECYDKSIAIKIELDDSKESLVFAPAYVDVKIVNGNKIVYNKTLVKDPDSYSTVSIPSKDIAPGITSTGTIYYKIYWPGIFSFDECVEDVEKLPFVVSIELPKVPTTYSSMRYNGYTDYSYKVTDISYVVEGNKIYLQVAGSKTYDWNGNNYSRSCSIVWKLYDSKGYVVKSGSWSTNSLSVEDKFIISYETNPYGGLSWSLSDFKPGEKYKLVFLNIS